ncbi:hypothetical protein [Serpentinicella alkaliphila]|nr:hypothetical protein [Serpentinicella alkaliphila]
MEIKEDADIREIDAMKLINKAIRDKKTIRHKKTSDS